jgi:hypothetical protein
VGARGEGGGLLNEIVVGEKEKGGEEVEAREREKGDSNLSLVCEADPADPIGVLGGANGQLWP